MATDDKPKAEKKLKLASVTRDSRRAARSKRDVNRFRKTAAKRRTKARRSSKK